MPERLGLTILRRITDSPIYAAECRHQADYWYSCEWVGKETGDYSRVNLVRKG
jgi:hypothetical protein